MPPEKPGPFWRYAGLQDGEPVVQKNEGKWAFTLREEGADIVLDVELGHGVLTSEIRGEVHPGLVRMLVKVLPHFTHMQGRWQCLT